MLQPEMRFYYWKEKGKIVVQNMIMGMEGQKHSHTPQEFGKWKRDIPKKDLIRIDEEKLR